MRRSRGASLLVAALALVAFGSPALVHAGTEEWSTFNPEAQELDDESLLDHVLNRPQRAWRDEWEHSTQAFRTSQGCLTSGVWFIDTDLKLQTPVGNRTDFGLRIRQSESDAEFYDYLELVLRSRTPWGRPGVWFRPFFDKSRQDFSLTWEVGADTTAEQVQLAFTIEDVFNNLWAFRQTQVGGLSEPYQRRPYEPGLRWVSRHERVRAEISGRWLTPSTKTVIDYALPVPDRTVTLWGTVANASLEVRALGLEWEAATDNKQAKSTDAPVDGSSGNNANFRRRWSVEGAVRRAITPELLFEARFIYQPRDANHAPPYGPNTFTAIDRLSMGELRWDATPRIAGRFGGMYDRITVGEAGPNHPFSYGTRNESRLYVGLDVRFGRVVFAGIEGIEMDPEKYDVWLWHDKGFLSMQARF